MKFLLTILLMGISLTVSAQSCPNLVGNYDCALKAPTRLGIRQVDKNHATVYSLFWEYNYQKPDVYTADGVERTQGAYPQDIQVTTDTCQKNSLKRERTTTIFYLCGDGRSECPQVNKVSESYSLQGDQLIYTQDGVKIICEGVK